MAGDSMGTHGPIKLRNPGLLLDVRLAPGATWQQAVPTEWNGFAVSWRCGHAMLWPRCALGFSCPAAGRIRLVCFIRLPPLACVCWWQPTPLQHRLPLSFCIQPNPAHLLTSSPILFPPLMLLQYVYEGSGRIGDKAAQIEHAYVLHNEGDTVSCELPALHLAAAPALHATFVAWAGTIRLACVPPEAGPMHLPTGPLLHRLIRRLCGLPPQVQATASEAGLKFLLICGKPIGEPIVQYGPFVMNHELEIRQVRRARCACCG